MLSFYEKRQITKQPGFELIIDVFFIKPCKQRTSTVNMPIRVLHPEQGLARMDLLMFGA